MKIILSIICFSVVCFSTIAQPSVSSKNQTQAKQNNEVKQENASDKTEAAADAIVLGETQFDFGKIPQGKPVTHVFTFTNTGKTPLSLENVQASCGCTTPEWSKDAVAPGETSKITVGYNAANEGQFTKTITITYNGSQNKQLLIKGEVWKTPAASAPDNSALNTLNNQ